MFRLLKVFNFEWKQVTLGFEWYRKQLKSNVEDEQECLYYQVSKFFTQ